MFLDQTLLSGSSETEIDDYYVGGAGSALVKSGRHSDFGALREGQCIIDVDAEVPDGVLDVRVPQEDLDGSDCLVTT